MRHLTAMLIGSPGLGWLVALVVAVIGGGLAGWETVSHRHGEELERLAIDAERRGVEIMSQTLNGNIMGALSLLGGVAQDIKLDARGAAQPNLPRISGLLEDVGRAHDAQGVFVVGGDGVVHTSWDSSGRPSTGLDVAFRPYYKMAMQGKDNVYAAVSLARGDRALYFSAPVRAAADRNGTPIGAVVARTGLERVDALLKGRSGVALLLSPQGVVFAGNRQDWVGHLAGGVTPERLRAIRDLKQFGAMFDKADPPVLPFDTRPGIVRIDGRDHALAVARVQWNDPYGDWSVVLGSDLSATGAAREGLRTGLAAGGALLLIVGLLFKLARGHQAQKRAARRIELYAREQAEAAARSARRAEAALRLQRAKGADDLGRVFLAEAHDMLGALQGAVYAFEADGDDAMRLLAAYAAPPGLPAGLAPGGGLLGQCVLDRRPRVLSGEQVEGWSIRSGLGNARPAAVLMAPLLLDERALGAAEISVPAAPSPADVAQFEELVALLALNLEIQRRQTPCAAAINEATP